MILLKELKSSCLLGVGNRRQGLLDYCFFGMRLVELFDSILCVQRTFI